MVPAQRFAAASQDAVADGRRHRICTHAGRVARVDATSGFGFCVHLVTSTFTPTCSKRSHSSRTDQLPANQLSHRSAGIVERGCRAPHPSRFAWVDFLVFLCPEG